MPYTSDVYLTVCVIHIRRVSDASSYASDAVSYASDPVSGMLAQRIPTTRLIWWF